MAKKFRFHLPWIFWVFLISILSFTPGDQLPSLDWNLISPDKLIHFAMYFVLSILLGYGFIKNKMNPLSFGMYLVLILVGMAYGYFVELIQGNFIYQRYYDSSDIIANSFGTIFGVFLLPLMGRKILLTVSDRSN